MILPAFSDFWKYSRSNPVIITNNNNMKKLNVEPKSDKLETRTGIK